MAKRVPTLQNDGTLFEKFMPSFLAREKVGLRGQGVPEGVVTAPPGTEYIDEDATRGAIKWIKTGGTDEFGWRVIYGDTGERSIQANSLGNGAVSGTAHLRRRNNTVTVFFNNLVINPNAPVCLIFAAAQGRGLPYGYAAHTGERRNFIVGRNGDPLAAERITIISDTDIQWVGNSSDQNINIQGTIEYLTADNWPGFLPGVAV